MEDDNGDTVGTLLGEAVDAHRKDCRPAQSTMPFDAARIKGIEKSAKKRRRARLKPPRRNCQTTAVPSDYEYDIEMALEKHSIRPPTTLAQVACEIHKCWPSCKDGARALRIIFLRLLVEDCPRRNIVQTQLLLEATLKYYDLLHMKGAFILGMHKYIQDRAEASS